MTNKKDKYRFIGPAYDWLANLYSGGAINKSKMAMLNPEIIQPGQRCLFVGAGQGKDAIKAAELGAKVTVVEISMTMIDQLSKHVEAARKISPDLQINIIHGDILEYSAFDTYDFVVINYFLNVFDPSTMETMLAHLIKLTKPKGHLVVGDFHYPSGNPVTNAIFMIYWTLAIAAFWIAAKNALHKIYNYPKILTEHGLEIVDIKTFPLLGIPCSSSILCKKLD